MKNRYLRKLVTLSMVGIAVSVTGGASMASTPDRDITPPSHLQGDPLAVDLYCDPFLNDTVLCYAIVYGGSEPYSYSWIGAQPTGFSSSHAFADCYPGQWAYVELLVTDSNGSTGGAWKSFQC
jgi:hypothetical protein